MIRERGDIQRSLFETVAAKQIWQLVDKRHH